GLADVVGALPKYQNKLGLDASVVMPWYNRPFTREQDFDTVYESTVALRELHLPFRILKESKDTLGFPLFMIRINGLLDRDNVYVHDDSTLQFIAFEIDAIQWKKETQNLPYIIHCHKYHTLFVPFLVKYAYYIKEMITQIKSVVTSNNDVYQ